MGAEFIKLGFLAGQKVAHDCRKEIRRAHKDDIPNLAGVKMHLVIREAKNPIYDSDSWKSGFFDGFLEKAEEMRG